MHRRQFLASISSAAAAAPWITAHAADSWPAKPIRLVVPFPPGGGNDVVARLIGEAMAPALKQPVVVENRVGAGGNLGTDFVAKSPPDGYTLVHVSNSVVMNPYLYKRIPFDIVHDLQPIGLIATTPMLICANSSAGINSLDDLIKRGREHKGQLSYASPGNGTPHHFAMELLKSRTGADFLHVPYKGAAPALADVIGGQVPVLVATPASVADFIGNGRLRVLATMDRKRLASYPDAPSVAEVLPSYNVNIWHGLMAPTGLPSGVADLLARRLREALSEPDMKKKLLAVSFTPQYEPAAAMQARIVADLATWKDVAAKAQMVQE